MSAKPNFITPPSPPPERPAGIPDAIWAFPETLATLSRAYGFFQKDVARAARVTQSAVSRWINYDSLERLAAAKIIMIEKGLGLPLGVLLPQSAPEDSEALKKRAVEIGIVPTVVVALGDKLAGETMQAFSEEVRRAILGVVHVYGYTLEQAASAAQRVWGKEKPMLRAGLQPSDWYNRIRDELSGSSTSQSGTYPQSDKIKIPSATLRK